MQSVGVYSASPGSLDCRDEEVFSPRDQGIKRVTLEGSRMSRQWIWAQQPLKLREASLTTGNTDTIQHNGAQAGTEEA